MSNISKKLIKQAIQLSNNQGRYQKCMIALFTFLWIEISLFLIGPSFIYMNPTFNCTGSNQSQKFLEDTACLKLNQCTLTDYFTLTSQLHLYCDQKFLRGLIQVIFSVGAFLGLLIINFISDIKSRKYAAILALSIANLGSVSIFLGGTYQSIFLLIVSQFLSGFGAYSLIPITYAYLTDFCSDKYRQRGVVFVNSGWYFYQLCAFRGLSTIILGILYLLKTHWSVYLMYFVLIPFFALSILLSLFLLQSPYVVAQRNNQKQALQVIIQLSKFNNSYRNILQIEEIFQIANINDQLQHKIKDLPSVSKMLRTLIEGGYLKKLSILMIICSISTLHLYGVAFAMQIQGLGYGVNSIIAGIIIFTSFLYLNHVIQEIPRKYGMALSFTVLALLGLLFLIPKIKHNPILTTLVLGVSRVASNVAYTLLACVQTEAFTPEIQSIASALIQTFSVMGVLFGPLVVELAKNIHLDPIVFISILLNFAIWPSFFLPNKLNRSK